MSRIEQLIDEIEEFVESCKPQPFSQTKIIVPKDELFELLTELRLKTPDEIKRYQKIIATVQFVHFFILHESHSLFFQLFLLKMPLLAPTHSPPRQESGSKSSHRAHRPANAV